MAARPLALTGLKLQALRPDLKLQALTGLKLEALARLTKLQALTGLKLQAMTDLSCRKSWVNKASRGTDGVKAADTSGIKAAITDWV